MQAGYFDYILQINAIFFLLIAGVNFFFEILIFWFVKMALLISSSFLKRKKYFRTPKKWKTPELCHFKCLINAKKGPKML